MKKNELKGAECPSCKKLISELSLSKKRNLMEVCSFCNNSFCYFCMKPFNRFPDFSCHKCEENLMKNKNCKRAYDFFDNLKLLESNYPSFKNEKIQSEEYIQKMKDHFENTKDTKKDISFIEEAIHFYEALNGILLYFSS